MDTTDTTAPTDAEMSLMIKAIRDRAKRLIGPAELRDSIQAKGLAYRLQGKHVEGIMWLTQKGADLAYEAMMAEEGKTIAPPFTDADALEDSALLKALEVASGNVHAPDGARLVAQGLATVDEERGHYFLTEDGRAVAEALRTIERDLITDDVLKVINLYGGGRAAAEATGWIAGVTRYEERVYIELVRLPHTSPYTFSILDAWTSLRFQLYSKFGIHAEIEGARLYIPATLGNPDEARAHSDRIRAGFHADAVWADLCAEGPGATLRVSHEAAPGDPSVYRAPAALVFHHESRDVRLYLDERGRYVAEIVSGPDTGRTFAGHRADVAVKAMARALYGTPCAHGYNTGRDSCPGCDATAERFEDRYTMRGAMPGSLPALTRP